jgi:hypothetical protein
MFISFEEFYDHLQNELVDSQEVLSKSYNITLKNYYHSLVSGNNTFVENANKKLVERKESEYHFYNFLEHQLFINLQEMKYYSDVNLNDTRRLISVSNNCISLIHIIVREEIHVNIYFRSSDLDGALPIDLEFVSSLPFKLIQHCKTMKNHSDYVEVDDSFINKLKKHSVKYNITFGSLHRTI